MSYSIARVEIVKGGVNTIGIKNVQRKYKVGLAGSKILT
jgi:hypothetical protein